MAKASKANTTALYILQNQGNNTDQIEMVLGKTKITLVFDNTKENPRILKRIEDTLMSSCNFSVEELNA